jgi:hypothetical protein
VTRKSLRWLLASIITAFTLNAGIIFAFQPVSVQTDPSAAQEVNTYKGLQVLEVDELVAGGVAGWSRESNGYVNMVSDDPEMYITSLKNPDSASFPNTQLFRHESFHVVQKELIAEASGGYPSYWNPIRSFIYYANTARMNNDLQALMPKVNTEKQFVTAPGLEAAADCYAQPESSASSPQYYFGGYIFPLHCDAEQKKILDLMEDEDRWPSPLTESQKKGLAPVSISVTNRDANADYHMEKIKEILGYIPEFSD